MPLARGDAFGRYVVDEVIGSGGGGEVYRAHDTLLDRSVALKILRSADTDDGAGIARMLREARSVARLNHPHVVSVFDVGEGDGVPYMAMELVPGKPLRAHIGSPIPLDRKLRWLSDIALALDAAHESGVIHRDVKPENVIVRDDGFVKVVDFGIAQRSAVDPTGVTAGATEKSVAGTPHYMAPEQMRGEPLDGRADQFGWGVMAYELLTGGRYPWDASGGPLDYAASVLRDAPVPIRDRGAAVPSDVAAAIDRTLRRSKTERFPSMGDLVNALDPGQSPPSETPLHVIKVSSPAELANALTTKAPLNVPVPRPRSIAWVAAGLAAMALAGVIASRLRHVRDASDSRGSPSASSNAPSAVPITSLPLPKTTSRDALASYVEGVQAIRDGSSYIAIEKFEDALKHDPMMAEASMRLAILHLDRDDIRARKDYERAHELRSVLSERDRALLEAIEPLTNREGQGATEAAARLSALADRYPHDAEIAYELQLVTGDDGQLAAAHEVGARALAIDPSFYAALAKQGEEEAYLGNFDEAKATLERCIKQSGAASVCGFYLSDILQQKGDCDALGQNAQRLLVAAPSALPFYQDEAEAMLARGAPTAAVRNVLDLRTRGVLDDARERLESGLTFQLDVALGDFAGAEKAAGRYARTIEAEPSARLHELAAHRLADLYAETGRVAEAGRLARATLEGKEGWLASERLEDEGVAYDRTPVLLGFERAAGLLDQRAFEKKRADWVADWDAKAAPSVRGYLWIQAYATTVVTRDDAITAVEAFPRYGGIPPYRPNLEAMIGRVFLLADRLDEAMPLLEADAKRCVALRWPFQHLRSLYWLGRGYEAKRDRDSACKAYSAVLARWGAARPRSLTADDAQKRAAALRCSPLH